MTWRWRVLGLTWTCLCGCCRGVMTSSGDVRWHQQQSSARVRRVLSLPAHEENARNPRGTWGHVYGRMRAGISGSVDQWSRRPLWRRVCTNTIWKSGIWGGAWEIFWRQLWHMEVRGTTSGDRISGFSLWETEEHACVVGFFMQRLDFHRFVRWVVRLA